MRPLVCRNANLNDSSILSWVNASKHAVCYTRLRTCRIKIIWLSLLIDKVHEQCLAEIFQTVQFISIHCVLKDNSYECNYLLPIALHRPPHYLPTNCSCISHVTRSFWYYFPHYSSHLAAADFSLTYMKRIYFLLYYSLASFLYFMNLYIIF